jgi:hypothetical protein
MPVDPQTINHALSTIVNAILIVCLPFLVKSGLGYLEAHKAEVTSRLNQNVVSEVSWVAHWAVRQAEQYFGSAQGKAKKEMALHTLEKYLEGRGLVLDVSTIDAAVEQAVYETFNKPADPSATVVNVAAPSASSAPQP